MGGRRLRKRFRLRAAAACSPTPCRGLETDAVDNVTHSLIGHALGRALGDRAGQPELARAAIWTSVLASNAPDLDFIGPRFAHDRKLAYLLQHRGSTHTVLAALAMGAAIALLCCWLAKVRDPRARLRVLAIGVAAAWLHIAFDFLNNYGVHPFVPLDDRWFYGDAVFIVEPWLLALLIPQLALAGKSKAGRGLGFALALVLLAALWLAHVVPAGTAACASVGLMLGFVLQRAVKQRAAPSLYACALAVLVFAASSLHARSLLAAELATSAPRERIAELVLTPLPGNPLCWNGLALSSDAAGLYHARFARISIAPALVPNSRCAFLPRGTTTAPLRRAALVARNPALHFELELSEPLAELRALRSRVCEVDAALRFMRAPYWIGSRSPPVIGDLRYDNEPGLGFAEIEAHQPCRDAPPPWTPPLRDLLMTP